MGGPSGRGPGRWLVHDIDLALIPVVLASGPVPCEQPLVVIRPLITTLSFEVTCGGEISYYFDGEGARIPELDLVTAEGIDEALAEILAEPLAVAASGQVELVVLHQSEGVMDLAVTVQYEDAAGILLGGAAHSPSAVSRCRSGWASGTRSSCPSILPE